MKTSLMAPAALQSGLQNQSPSLTRKVRLSCAGPFCSRMLTLPLALMDGDRALVRGRAYRCGRVLISASGYAYCGIGCLNAVNEEG